MYLQGCTSRIHVAVSPDVQQHFNTKQYSCNFHFLNVLLLALYTAVLPIYRSTAHMEEGRVRVSLFNADGECSLRLHPVSVQAGFISLLVVFS